MMSNSLERGAVRVQGFANAEMDHQLMRQLGTVRYGGAALGACLAAVGQIQDGDPESWVSVFGAMGRQQLQDAHERLTRGHNISARDQFLVASNSLRAAEYLSPVDSNKHLEFGLSSREAFLESLNCAGIGHEILFFEQNAQRLPAYFITSPYTDTEERKNKTAFHKVLAIVSGYDGTLEESYISYGYAALERGYDLMLFTGPGQMDAWRFQSECYFTPDFEHIGRKVIDYLYGRYKAAPRIALMGISFGGYFAMRIAAYEPRLNALIPNSPILDLHAYMVSFVGADPVNFKSSDNFSAADIVGLPDQVLGSLNKLMSYNLISRFGQGDFIATYKRLHDFHLTAAQVKNIRCPVLALVGEGEGAEPLKQWQQLQDLLPGQASAYKFSAAQGGDAHCQVGNLSLAAAVALDWCDEVLAAGL